MFFFTLEGVLAKGACTPLEAQGKNHPCEMKAPVLEPSQPLKPSINHPSNDFYHLMTASLLVTHNHL